jgi:hypothetical protein
VSRRRLTEEQQDDIVARYRAGETILAISIAMGHSTCAVRNALIARGVTRRPAAGRGRARLNYSPQERV